MGSFFNLRGNKQIITRLRKSTLILGRSSITKHSYSLLISTKMSKKKNHLACLGEYNHSKLQRAASIRFLIQGQASVAERHAKRSRPPARRHY